MRRDGFEKVIHPGDIVVGDVVKITAGMDVPVDGIVLKGSSGIEANESAMTGESDDLKKKTMKLVYQRGLKSILNKRTSLNSHLMTSFHLSSFQVLKFKLVRAGSFVWLSENTVALVRFRLNLSKTAMR